jgi:hypothetical protein
MAEEVETKPVEVKHGGAIEVARGTFYVILFSLFVCHQTQNMGVAVG